MANNMLLPVSRYTSPAFPLNPPFARGSYTPETSSNQSRGPKVDQLRTVVVVVVVVISGFLLFPTLTPHPINPHSNFPSSLLLPPPPPPPLHPFFFNSQIGVSAKPKALRTTTRAFASTAPWYHRQHPCHRVFFEACGVGMAGIAGTLRKDDRSFSFWGFLVGGWWCRGCKAARAAVCIDVGVCWVFVWICISRDSAILCSIIVVCLSSSEQDLQFQHTEQQ